MKTENVKGCLTCHKDFSYGDFPDWHNCRVRPRRGATKTLTTYNCPDWVRKPPVRKKKED